MPSKSGVSVVPSPLGLLQSSPTELQSQVLQGLLFSMPDSQAVWPDVGPVFFVDGYSAVSSDFGVSARGGEPPTLPSCLLNLLNLCLFLGLT